MRIIALLLVICCLLTACGTDKEKVKDTLVTTESIKEISKSTETTETKEIANAEPITVSPLPETIDIDNLENCAVKISFNEGDIYEDENGVHKMDAIIYTFDLYDIADFTMLTEGDFIAIRGNNVEISSLEYDKLGNLFVNGGLDNGGYQLTSDDTNFYYELGYSDTNYWYELGKTTIKISPEFEYTDMSDLDNDPVIYHLEDFLKEDSNITYNFTPHNTEIIIESGQLVSMIKTYAP